jgi:hypothetical protein
MKNMKIEKGGKVLASGGFGCVFSPALKCEGATKRETNKISKLMTEKHATEEYAEINSFKEKLDKIPNYEDYFLIYDATLCRPAKLTATDLTEYASTCSALPKNNITKTNINSNLDKLMSLNIPNGGLPVDDFIYQDGSFEKLYKIHSILVKLLKKGPKYIQDYIKKLPHIKVQNEEGDVKIATRIPQTIHQFLFGNF